MASAAAARAASGSAGAHRHCRHGHRRRCHRRFCPTTESVNGGERKLPSHGRAAAPGGKGWIHGLATQFVWVNSRAFSIHCS